MHPEKSAALHRRKQPQLLDESEHEVLPSGTFKASQGVLNPPTASALGVPEGSTSCSLAGRDSVSERLANSVLDVAKTFCIARTPQISLECAVPAQSEMAWRIATTAISG